MNYFKTIERMNIIKQGMKFFACLILFYVTIPAYAIDSKTVVEAKGMSMKVSVSPESFYTNHHKELFKLSFQPDDAYKYSASGTLLITNKENILLQEIPLFFQRDSEKEEHELDINVQDFGHNGWMDFIIHTTYLGSSPLWSDDLYLFDVKNQKFILQDDISEKGEITIVSSHCVDIEYRTLDERTYNTDRYCLNKKYHKWHLISSHNK